MRKVPSRLPLSISSAWVRLILPTYHVRSSWWGRASSSSITEYWLWSGAGPVTHRCHCPASELTSTSQCKRSLPLKSSLSRVASHSLLGLVFDSQPLVDLPLSGTFLGEPPDRGKVGERVQGLLRQVPPPPIPVGSECSVPGGQKHCRGDAGAPWWDGAGAQNYSHKVLVPDLAQLHEVGLEAVHALVDLSIV